MTKFESFSKEITEYDLGDGYRLKAEKSEDMAKHYAVYYQLQNHNNFLKKSFDLMFPTFEDEDDESRFWIIKDDVRIGGVCLDPNLICALFLIPPYDNEVEILNKLKEILVYWSDEAKDIEAFVINKEQVRSYEEVGFERSGAGRWMIRPTQEFEVNIEDDFYIELPKEENISEMANLIVEAESNNPALTPSSAESIINWITKYYFGKNPHSDCLNKASTLIYDKKSKELVGVCLISLWEEWPLIGEIDVKPGYDGRGLGTKMIKRALSVLKDEFPVLRLHVDIGNKAEILYHSLGFVKGTEMVEMKLKNSCFTLVH